MLYGNRKYVSLRKCSTTLKKISKCKQIFQPKKNRLISTHPTVNHENKTKCTKKIAVRIDYEAKLILKRYSLTSSRLICLSQVSPLHFGVLLLLFGSETVENNSKMSGMIFNHVFLPFYGNTFEMWCCLHSGTFVN